MPNKLKIESFEPLRLKKAQQSLEKHFKAAQEHGHTNEGYKQSVFKETLLKKFVRLFKRKN